MDERLTYSDLERQLAELQALHRQTMIESNQRLGAERQRFIDVMSLMPAYVILISPDYQVPFANQFFEERFGKSNGRRCFEYLFNRTEPCENCETFKVFQTNTPHRWEWVGPDGRDYDIYDFPFTNADGSPLIMEVGLDITERKKAAAKLQIERQRLFDVLETLPAMICLLTHDHHVAFANRGFRERFGDSQGRHCYDYCFCQTKPCDFCQSDNVLKTGRPHHWEVQGPDGSVIDAYDFPFTDADGTPLVLEMGIDITERRKTEIELARYRGHLEDLVKERTARLEQINAKLRMEISEREKAEEQLLLIQKTFAELVERAPFGIYVIDSQFRISQMNSGSQTGAFRNVRPLIGRNLAEVMRILWPESVAAEIIARFRHTLETGEPYYSPGFTHPRHDIENTESYEWELHRIMLSDGQYGVICYYFDSTELRNAESALQEAKATLERKVEERTQELAERAAQLRTLTGQLTLAEQRERSRLAIILHDHLQQLLVAAKFRLTILGRGGDDIVRQASKEVEDLIDDSILASRSLTAELSPPILREAGLKEGLQWLAKRMADTQGLFVDLELNDCGPMPEDLKILLFQSIRELLFNVVKHAHTRSAVVNLRSVDALLQVTVSDQGIGFDPTAMPSAGEGGRGFGLLGIQERLGFMGGRLEIESNRGQGSRFVLCVPIISPTTNESQLPKQFVAPQEHVRTAEKLLVPGRKVRVMLADDHAVVRQGIANLLADETDIEIVGQAADGQEAIDLALKLLPEVILMDVSMPKLNGVEATRAIRNELPEIRIIGLSMFEDSERAQAMRDAGAVAYLTKSGKADVLINAIRTSVQTSKEHLSTRIDSFR